MRSSCGPVCLLVSMLVPAAGALVGAPGLAHADLATCRAALLTDLDPAAAGVACDAAVAMAPSDPQARLLRALARLARLPFQPSVDALADAFGLSEDGRFPPDGNLLLPTGQLDPESPLPSEVQAVVASDVLPAIDAALADLGAIEPPLTLVLTPAELASLGITSANGIEIDEADALLLAGVLEAAGAALRAGLAYDLELDVDDAVLRFRTSLDIQDEILAAHPDLLTLLPAAPARMAEAKQGLCAAIDAYHLAMQAIAGEVDGQDDDLVVVTDPQLAFQLSQELARLRAALDGPTRVLVGTEAWKARWRAGLNDALGTAFTATGATLDLRAAFDAPASLRPLAPGFGFDPTAIPPSKLASFPDPSFAGALSAAPPGDETSATPCPPAVVPEAPASLAAGAVLLALLGVGRGRRRHGPDESA